ncbi:hypothetical protein Strvi_6554 [Streptomyces violaceusniger Tu 4113]|uniref:Uncharacterized protein n=1 Tax=Streptomyces violaceusniger (strain Tu 4113) TaxID=653045 RepID=G2P0F8_STRV4|nr:hypothetical protein Strvi_6554 [Streptomyces violaceusniger Tu 4113]
MTRPDVLSAPAGSVGGVERVSDFLGDATAVVHLMAVLASPCTNLFRTGTVRGAPAHPARLLHTAQVPAFLDKRPESRVQFVAVLRSEDELLATLGRLLTDTEIPIRLRVAGVIVLLYAQPLSRVVRLTLDDFIRDGDAVLLRLGEPPSPVPAPVAAPLLEHITNRGNMNTATNPASRWL